MSDKVVFLSPIDLNWNQLYNTRFQILASDPATSLEGGYYYNSTTHKLMYHNGTAWTPVGDTYSLPIATATVLGGIKSGGDISIDGTGIITITDNSHNHISANITDLATVVKAYKLNEFATPTGDIALGTHKITGLANGSSATDAVNKGQLDTAIATFSGGLIYKGTVPTATIPTTAKQGWFYKVDTSGTYYGIVCNIGDMLIVNHDLSATPISTDLDKIDNTESADIVRLTSTQTLTNKTIDANSNTITNLDADNFTAGVILSKYTAQNPALTPTGGVCTWTVAHNKNSTAITISMRRISDNAVVMASYTITDANTLTISIASTVSVTANTYEVVII